MKNIERGAMKQALEALESTYKVFHEDEEIEDAITSLRQAIAEAEQCKYPNCDYPCMNLPDCNYVIKWSDYESNGRIIKEQPAQPETEHEPDDLTIAYLSGFYDGRKKREWVGLTDEEVEKMRHLIDWTAHWSYGTFARTIEAKLKEKNT